MKRGFTLIELLVVIAIIAILAAILFPVFARAREKARQSSCLSNVKQITLGILMYTQDYDETFPQLYYKYPTPRGIEFFVQPYVSNYQVFNCPSSDRKRSNTSTYQSYSYGYHTGLISSGAHTLGEVKRPAEIVLMGDVCQDRNVLGRLLSPVNSGGAFQCDPDGSNCRVCGATHNSFYADPLSGPAGTHSSQYDRPGFNFLERHNGTGNAGFVDGHAKAMKHMELYQNANNHPYFDHKVK